MTFVNRDNEKKYTENRDIRTAVTEAAALDYDTDRVMTKILIRKIIIIYDVCIRKTDSVI